MACACGVTSPSHRRKRTWSPVALGHAYSTRSDACYQLTVRVQTFEGATALPRSAAGCMQRNGMGASRRGGRHLVEPWPSAAVACGARRTGAVVDVGRRGRLVLSATTCFLRVPKRLCVCVGGGGGGGAAPCCPSPRCIEVEACSWAGRLLAEAAPSTHTPATHAPCHGTPPSRSPRSDPASQLWSAHSLWSCPSFSSSYTIATCPPRPQSRPPLHLIPKPVVESLPFFHFATLRGARQGMECSMCLACFDHADHLRLLPRYRHAFHLACINRWLESNASCPLCRARVDADDTSLPSSACIFFGDGDLSSGRFVDDAASWRDLLHITL
ncbi:hypothetical protein PVAP13_9KG030925 [Panicum virgatum]|uniref:RING-type domain-containing protein n=1 Tax=Panicum virgatum TaxID=38727 RepID=A0A8T0NBS4_PANVG|nr:hypothetical protein PVAP13_9KG030925 [Panicum virgatum]